VAEKISSILLTIAFLAILAKSIQQIVTTR
jgi:hypothetical protein